MIDWPLDQLSTLNGPVQSTLPCGLPYALPFPVRNALLSMTPGMTAISWLITLSGRLSFIVTWWASVTLIEATLPNREPQYEPTFGSTWRLRL